MHIDTLVQRLSAGGPTASDPAGVLVCCPAHGDRNPSLLISVTGEHKAVLHCRSHGCDTASILTQAGLTWADLFRVDGQPTVETSASDGEVGAAEIAALAIYLDRVQAAYPGSPAAEYARHRWGITDELGRELGLGYDDGTQPFAQATGAFSDYPRLVVPYRDRDGIARGCQGRDVSGKDPHRWAGLANPEGKRWAVLGWLNPTTPGPVLVTEGPGDALAAAAVGYAVVFLRGTWAARRGGTATSILAGAAGRDVVLAGDADEAGQQFTDQLAERLREQGTIPRALALPGGHGDLADWYAAAPAEFTDELTAAVQAAPVITDPAAATYDGDPTVLLDEVRDFLARFVTLNRPEWFDVITLWIATTYFVRASESADVAPRLGFVSTVPGSGKTLALDLVCRLCAGHLIIDPTAASVLRAISAMSYDDDDPEKPDTPVPLGIDEADNLYAARGQDTSSITAILNSGYKRGNTVVRAHSDNQRKAINYETFAPVVWAGLARTKLPDALLSRTFVIEMEQALPEERPHSFRPRRHGPEADDLADSLATWVASVADDDTVSDLLDQAEADFADEVSNRDLELWSVLAVPALLAGGGWPQRALAACRGLRGIDDQAENISVRFLRATRDVYSREKWGRGINDPVVFRAELAERVMDTDAIFRRWNAGNGLDDEHVRELLREFQVLPRPVRVGKEISRGFRWADMQPKWDRYLGEDDQQPVTD